MNFRSLFCAATSSASPARTYPRSTALRFGYPFHGSDVVVVGSKNSAAEAALDLYRHGARVTLVARGPAISERVKYWIKPDLENRIRAGKIRAFFRTRILEIASGSVLVEGPAGKQSLPADAVFGIDLAGMDRSVAPGDDFFGYANGAWLKSTEIPPTAAATGRAPRSRS